jgi:porin
VPIEVGYDHGKTPFDYAGTLRLGTYYDTSRVAELGDTGNTVEGRSGLLVQAAQQIWKPHPDTVRGIAVFGVYTEADRKTGLLPAYYELGSSWRGPFASRPDDVLSVSGVQANINTRVRDAERFAGKDARTHEQMWELNYGVQVRPWLLVRPAVQYVVHPGGDRNRPDTAVFVCHFQAVF